MSGVRKGGNHAMQDVSTHHSSGNVVDPTLIDEYLEEHSFGEIRDEAIELEVFKVGMKKRELAAAIIKAGG